MKDRKKHKAPGLSGLVAEMIQATGDIGTQWILDLCNEIVKEGSIPEDWALSPLLFVIVMEAISREISVALPWELLYADDLAVIAETEEELIKRFNEWKDNMESKGMRVNMNKTKVISGERQKVMQKAVRWPCGVCSKGVGSNSLVH